MPQKSRVSMAAKTTGASSCGWPQFAGKGFVRKTARVLSKSRHKCLRTTQEQADPLQALVAASRLELDHVVTRRWLRQLKEPRVTFRSLSTRSFVSNCIEDRGPSAHHCPDETRRANASSHKCRAVPAENDGGRLWKTTHSFMI